jgi:hypothetical protein
MSVDGGLSNPGGSLEPHPFCPIFWGKRAPFFGLLGAGLDGHYFAALKAI